MSRVAKANACLKGMTFMEHYATG